MAKFLPSTIALALLFLIKCPGSDSAHIQSAQHDGFPSIHPSIRRSITKAKRGSGYLAPYFLFRWAYLALFCAAVL